MKHLLLLFILSVSALCITSTDAGSYNDGSFLLRNDITHSRGKIESHKILRRQSAGGESDSSSQCAMLISSRGCTNGMFQELADVLQGCNDPVNAQGVQAVCERNTMDTYCGAASQSSSFNNVLRSCFGTSSSPSPNCSSDCRNFLVAARSELGCCVNALNTSAGDEIRPYNYSLWSSCDIEPVTQECRTSTITLRSFPIDSTCNNNSLGLAERVWSTICRRRYVEDVRQELSATTGCQDQEYQGGNTCHANEKGTYCIPLIVVSNDVSERCRDTSTCNASCITSVNNLFDNMGCCVNTLQNNTAFRPSWLSYEFLSRCGLESPGLCQELLNNDDRYSAGMKLNASFIVFVFAIAGMLMFMQLQ